MTTPSAPGPALALIGMGRMGRVVRQLADARGWRIVAERRAADGPIAPGDLDGADVAIEFTEPGSAVANIMGCLDARCPVVCGTTGWDDQLPAVVRAAARTGGAVLHDANFSIGAHLFRAVAASAVRAVRAVGGYETAIIEVHHSGKRDAPSGTARRLADAIGDGAPVPISSVRVGSVPGTHTVICDGAFDTLQLEHVVRDRRVFADGALVAAAWLVGRQGVFTMDDVVGGGA
jgi:4-hydroxy-tetrahydrodipicolinate reductase